MVDAGRTARKYGCVVAIAAVCTACGASAPGFAQSCGERGVPYIVDVPGDYAGAGWYDPYDPWPASGDDSSDPGGDPGSGGTTDPGDDAPPDPSGSGDDSSGDDTGGDDSGGDGADSMRIHVQNAVGGTHAERFEGDVCFSCPIMCTLSTSTPIAGSSIGSSSNGFADACAHAQSDLRHWAHEKFAARITACRIDDVSP